MIQTTPRRPTFPPEILGNILSTQSVARDPSALANAALASRTVQFEAERVLYTSVALDSPTKWAAFLAALRSEHAGEMRRGWVRSLAVSNVRSAPKEVGIVHEILKLLDNLIDLKLLLWGNWSTVLPATKDGKASTYPFRLRSFDTDSGAQADILSFLSSQPTITSLRLQSYGIHTWSFPSHILPNLNRIVAHPTVLQQLIPSRPVSAVSSPTIILSLSQVQFLAMVMKDSKKPIRVLALEAASARLTDEDVLVALSDHLGELESMIISANAKKLLHESDWVKRLSNFKSLKSIFITTSSISPTDALPPVRLCKQHCPSVERVVFRTWSPGLTYFQYTHDKERDGWALSPYREPPVDSFAWGMENIGFWFTH